MTLKNTLRHLKGEEMITHLGAGVLRLDRRAKLKLKGMAKAAPLFASGHPPGSTSNASHIMRVLRPNSASFL